MLTNNDDGQTDGQPDYNQMPPEALAKEAQRLKDLSAEVETKQRQLESERKQEQDEFARTVTESLVAKAFRECGATFTTDDRTELNKLLSTVAAVSLNENGVGLKVRDRATGQMTTIDHAIEKLITVFPELVNAKTLSPKLKGLVEQSEGKDTKLYKSDFTTAKEKSDYIARFGLHSWEQMALRRPEFDTVIPANPALMTREQWLNHSPAERAVLITKMVALGVDVERAIAHIMRRK